MAILDGAFHAVSKRLHRLVPCLHSAPQEGTVPAGVRLRSDRRFAPFRLSDYPVWKEDGAISFGVVLVDDDVCLLKGLELAIDKHARIELRGAATGCEEAMSLIRSVNPDVIVVDIDLDDGDGYELIRAA